VDHLQLLTSPQTLRLWEVERAATTRQRNIGSFLDKMSEEEMVTVCFVLPTKQTVQKSNFGSNANVIIFFFLQHL
jgi:hypothetical protein